jgi:hypothetical protein
MQEQLLNRAFERVLQQVETAKRYEAKEIVVYTIPGMTKETQRRFWMELANAVGEDAFRQPWTIEGTLKEERA